MGSLREIRDPIHGFVDRTELEQAIMDTSAMQRLRGIRQLALANLVYPGALHTLFEHCLGVMHIAGKLSRRLIKDDETYELLRLAGLVHDLGHGPFSHVSEAILQQFKTVNPEAIGKKDIHEYITIGILENCEEIRGIIGNLKRDRIIGYLAGTFGEGIERGIIVTAWEG
jgi:HD superfamily phosphohydrolase